MGPLRFPDSSDARADRADAVFGRFVVAVLVSTSRGDGPAGAAAVAQEVEQSTSKSACREFNSPQRDRLWRFESFSPHHICHLVDPRGDGGIGIRIRFENEQPRQVSAAGRPASRLSRDVPCVSITPAPASSRARRLRPRVHARRPRRRSSPCSGRPRERIGSPLWRRFPMQGRWRPMLFQDPVKHQVRRNTETKKPSQPSTWGRSVRRDSSSSSPSHDPASAASTTAAFSSCSTLQVA